MLRMLSFVVVSICLILAAGCGKESPSEPGQHTATVSEMAGSEAAPAPGTTGNQGRVLVTMDVAGYSYILVESNGREVWLAGNPIVVQEGEIVSWQQASVMRNFRSKTLDRTFDEIMFVSGLKSSSAEAGPLSANHPSMIPPAMSPSPMSAKAAEPAGRGMVVSTQDAAGYTYVEVKLADDSIVWLAAPQTALATNNTVEWQAGSKMLNFVSSSLGKTFPEIYFVAGVSVTK